MIRNVTLALTAFIAFSQPSPVLAWGVQGHKVVANLAQAQLSAPARREVDRLLALEPGETLASISTWADEHRNPTTAGWHYINFPRDTCTFDKERDCPGGQCVVGAIEKQVAVLRSNAPDERRLAALKYLVHLVADVHQPLHGGYRDDKGGNTYQVQAFGRGSNLHALWDSGLIKSMDEDVDTLAARLQRTPASKSVSDLNLVHAAEESCRIVGEPGFYPERKVPAVYVDRYLPTLDQRLKTAGSRLAGLLNQALD
ncbi:S1/P1 nuclease [Rhodoferax sp. PAMC 29310]|uniref:S1/P1 nuclease n=1 Tax=Rhodoferax sp. PAMC 29310 TaxID=2822760 RepID=UPI001B33C0CD|nr:S1/P1 nuclease [Rhodoferax sp. PAMC 29310]